MNLPEHSWQPVEARDGGGGLLRCFSCLLPPASLCPCYSQSLPQVCLPSLHCLPASACPLLSHSHPFYSWRSWTGVPVPCICCLPCPVALSTVLLFSFSLSGFVISPLTHGSPGPFKAGLYVIEIQMRSRVVALLFLVNSELEDTPVVEILR